MDGDRDSANLPRACMSERDKEVMEENELEKEDNIIVGGD